VKKFNFLLRLIIGGWFLYFGLLKIVEPSTIGPWQVPVIGQIDPVPVPTLHWDTPDNFAKNIGNFRMVPRAALNLMAITLPWIEVLAGFMLIVGFWKRPSALLIAAMLAVFLVAIGQAVYRHLDIRCGCEGTTGGRKVGTVALVEDGLGFLAALWLSFWYKK
jgi:uncharacterized membrane protein YphA (DoxX/SURF4 family)